MPKYYIALINLDTNKMQVPVKAFLNPYNNRPAYCAGMPQFFGGTAKANQQPVVLMKKEINEESRHTLKLGTASPIEFFNEKDMFFYWAKQGEWEQTGRHWGEAHNDAEKEMDRLEEVDLTSFTNEMPDVQIIEELVKQTGSATAPAEGKDQFAESATRSAFVRLIRMYLSGSIKNGVVVRLENEDRRPMSRA